MKDQIILPNNIAEFLYRAYFDFSDGFINAAIKRAYRDLNRTLKNFPKNEDEKIIIRNKWISFLKDEIENVVLTRHFGSWDSFTEWHRNVCQGLINLNTSYNRLTIGQAQKWVNMTLKYLYVLGESRVKGIGLNYSYFHIPIDNIIQEQILTDLGKSLKDKVFGTWSTINNYEEYLNYQKNIIKFYPNRIPMDVELELFNNGIILRNKKADSNLNP